MMRRVRLWVNSDGLVPSETFPVSPRKPTWQQTSFDFAFVPGADSRQSAIYTRHLQPLHGTGMRRLISSGASVGTCTLRRLAPSRSTVIGMYSEAADNLAIHRATIGGSYSLTPA